MRLGGKQLSIDKTRDNDSKTARTLTDGLPGERKAMTGTKVVPIKRSGNNKQGKSILGMIYIAQGGTGTKECVPTRYGYMRLGTRGVHA